MSTLLLYINLILAAFLIYFSIRVGRKYKKYAGCFTCIMTSITGLIWLLINVFGLFDDPIRTAIIKSMLWMRIIEVITLSTIIGLMIRIYYFAEGLKTNGH